MGKIANKYLKKIGLYTIAYIFSVPFLFISKTHASSQTDGLFVVSQLRDSMYNIQEIMKEIIKKTNNTAVIMSDIQKADEVLKKVKDQNGITPAETAVQSAQNQLDTATAIVISKAVDPTTHLNLYRSIYMIIKEIFSDTATQNDFDAIANLQQEIALTILSSPSYANPWSKQIQSAGRMASQLALNEIKATSQIQATLQVAQGQLLTTRAGNKDVDEQLVPLERKLFEENLAIQAQLTSDLLSKIRNNSYIIQRLTFLLELTQDPLKAAQATASTIAAFDTSAPFAFTP